MLNTTNLLELNNEDFDKLVPQNMKKLRRDNSYTDVTLVSSEGKHISAHQNILCLNSDFFKQLLSDNSHPNPLVYMKGITADNLNLILDFLYLGLCRVEEDCLNTFIEVGEDLKIVGLMDLSNSNQQ